MANKWKYIFLKLAGIYNVIWGALVIIFPNLFFEFANMPLPIYPMIWQCVGMIVGVYGVGYWIAGDNPNVHWPIILVGFLGKIFGPIGFLWYVLNGLIPVEWGMIIIFNDIIWWLPFYLILKDAYYHNSNEISNA